MTQSTSSLNLPPGYKTTAECWQEYPRLPWPDRLGARGSAQMRSRQACIAASMRGEADPELQAGPAILRDPVALWRVKAPWRERPEDGIGRAANVVGRILDPGNFLAGGFQTGGDRLRSAAIGWRPPSMFGEDRFREAEVVGTALGGLDALAAAGIQPWTQLTARISQLPQLKLRGDAAIVNMPLLGIIRDGARGSGVPESKLPKTIEEGSEYIREVVTQHDLDAAAWHARVIRMMLIGQVAQMKRQLVEQHISSATSYAAMATSWFPPVGAALTAISLSAAAASGRTSMEKTIGEKLIERSNVQFDHELKLRNYRVTTKLYEQALAKSKLVEEQVGPEALQEAEKRAQLIKAGVWVGAVSVSSLALYLVATKLKKGRH